MVKPAPRSATPSPPRHCGGDASDRERLVHLRTRQPRKGRAVEPLRGPTPAVLTSVPADRLDAVWPVVEPWLARVCARRESDLTLEGLLDLCRSGRGQLIMIGREGHPPVAAGVTQVREHRDGTRSCWVLAVGGAGARAWRDTLGLIEAGARRLGCATVEFAGRAGWAGLLPDYAAHTYFRKVL